MELDGLLRCSQEPHTGSNHEAVDFGPRPYIYLFTFHFNIILKLKLNSVALVRDRTIMTERPPLDGEIGANFCG
jgi:hypothetical protein